MLRGRRLSVGVSMLCAALTVFLGTGMTAEASNTKNYLDTLNGGVASIIDPSVYNSSEILQVTLRAKQHVAEQAAEEQSTLVMAIVQNTLNVRVEPNE